MPFAHKVKEKRKRKKKLKHQQIKTQIKLSHLSDNTAAVAFEEGKQMPSIQMSVCLLSSSMGDPAISSVLLSCISLFRVCTPSLFYQDKAYER